MKVMELAKLLQSLPADQQALPVKFMDEVWLRDVEGISVQGENEFGTQDDVAKHIRLEDKWSH